MLLLAYEPAHFVMERGLAYEPAHFVMERAMRLGIKQRGALGAPR